MAVRGSLPTKLACVCARGDQRKLRSPLFWFAQSFGILAKLTVSFSDYLASWIEWAFSCKKKKFIVANLHNKRPRKSSMRCRCCQEGCFLIFKHIQRHAKTFRRGTKFKSLVPGRQVGTRVTCNGGKGIRKRGAFRTSEVRVRT